MVEEYTRGVELIVGAFVLNDTKDKILLFSSPKWGGKYVVAGGHVEAGETMENALRREVKEEIGVDVEELSWFELAEELVHPPEFKRNAHFVYVNYIVKLKSYDFTFNEELDSGRWFSFDEVLKSDKFRNSYKVSVEKIKTLLNRFSI